MSAPEAKKAPGAHYSGRNPVPNIQRFIESLDTDKKNRDAKLTADESAGQKLNQTNGEAKDHRDGQPHGVKGTRKTVTDPVTGNQVQIEDVNADFMKAVENPMVGRTLNLSTHLTLLTLFSSVFRTPISARTL